MERNIVTKKEDYYPNRNTKALNPEGCNLSLICSNSEEQERLLKLFEIFIEIDKNLKNKSYENNK